MELLDKIERDPTNITILCNTGWGVLRRKAVISVHLTLLISFGTAAFI